MPLTPRPLAPLALRLVEIPGIPRVRGVQAVGLARLPTLIRGGASPLRRAAEQHPAQHRDLLRQLRDPGIGLRERLLGPLGTLTPVRHISGVTGHRREGHVLQNTPSPSNTPRTAPGVSRTKPQPRRCPRLQTHAALTPHVTTGGHSDSARPPTGSPNTYLAGESVRWLPRRSATHLMVPCADFWVFDQSVVVFNHFDGNGDWVCEERRDDDELAKKCVNAFDAVWECAFDHEAYRPK